MRFYLGTDRANWLGLTDVPLFISHRTLAPRRSFPRALGPWCLDSGGFTELNARGTWKTTPMAYAVAVARYSAEIGNLAWASPMDWMCEPAVLARTGLAVAEHQRRTVRNYLDLRSLDPALPFVPVLQGWDVEDYLRCVDLYAAAGVDLTAEPVVGLGTVCRRQNTRPFVPIVTGLADMGIRLHAFGVKVTGLARVAYALESADSMAWSFAARMGERGPDCTHRPKCNHCLAFALHWRKGVLRALDRRGQQPHLGFAC